MAQDYEPLPENPVGDKPTPAHDVAPRNEPAPAHPEKTPFPLIIGALMLLTLIASVVVERRELAAASAPAPVPATTPETVAAPAPADATAPAPAATTGADAGLKEEFAALSKRVEGLEGKVDAAAKGEAPGDFKALQAQVGELAKVPDMVKPLPEKLNALDDRIGSIGKELDGLKGQVASLDKGSVPAPAAGNAEAAPAPKDADEADQAMSDAVSLFKARKYKEASAAFGKLAQAKANDARVLYFAALSNGFATGNWAGGETVSLVKKGIEREKAGSPESSKIDEVFADLTKANGKDWLEGYRKLAK